jgi:hypothetical protein
LENRKGRGNLEYQDLDGRTILKLILRKLVVRMYIGFSLLRVAVNLACGEFYGSQGFDYCLFSNTSQTFFFFNFEWKSDGG